MPEGCPEIIDTPKFPSPTSCLPGERLQELEEKIAEANRLLLDLGLSNEQKETGRRVLLDGLKGKAVKIIVVCSSINKSGEEIHTPEEIHPETPFKQIVTKVQTVSGDPKNQKMPNTKRIKKKSLKYKRKRSKKNTAKDFMEGVVHLVGRNFVELSNISRKILIPFNRICVILTKRRYDPHAHEPALIDIDPCFRRELTFNFGETVANDPEFIQLFFRIPLSKYLEKFSEEKLTFYTDKGPIPGILKQIDNEVIFFEDFSGNLSSLPIDSICYM